MLAILAPVPAEILSDAFDVKNLEARIAFGAGWVEWGSSGADAFEFFQKPAITASAGSLSVLIYGSRRSDYPTKPHKLYHPGFVIAHAVYEGRIEAKNGKHPQPNRRPKCTLAGDTPCALFWKVSLLKAFSSEDRIPIGKLDQNGAPRGPRLISVPEDLIAVLKRVS